MSKYDDEKLQEFSIPALNGGYNNYTQSKTSVEDNEIIGSSLNVEVDETFTGIKKVGGSARVSTEISAGHIGNHIHIHSTETGDEVIAISGSVVSKIKPTQVVITGVTPTADLDYTSMQGGNKSYFLNGTDNPFSYDGSVLATLSTNQPTNGCGSVGVYYARRAYVTDKVNKDQVNFSGMFSPEDTKDYLFNFTTTTPVFAGYFRIKPGAGVEITNLFEGTDGLYIFTKQGEIYRAVPDGTTGLTAAQVHSVQLIARGAGASGAFATIQVSNDIHFFYDKYWNSLGYQQLYGNLLRSSNLSKRVKPELSSIVNKNKVAAVFFNDSAYISYGNTAYNNRVLKMSFKDRNFQMGAWSAPIDGWKVNKWAVYTDTSGIKHLYGASSIDSYINEYDIGSNNGVAAVEAIFEVKSFDCKRPGQIKYFPFIDVFYSTVFGQLSYQVFIDEVLAVEDVKQLGNSSSKGAGSGSYPSGAKPSGANYDPSTTFATLKQNSKLRIPCNFKRGQTVTVRLSNSNSNESFKINGLKIYFQEGSVYEG